MSMLGAQLDDLLILATRLRFTSSEIVDIQHRAASATGAMVDQLRSAAHQGFADIGTAMESLRVSISTTTARADATVWSGANATSFISAQHDLDQALAAAEAATTAAFADFTTNISRMADGIEHYVQGLGASFDAANQASLSMANAVEQQHQRLDEAMNQGLRVQ